jgi:hypothetical protein
MPAHSSQYKPLKKTKNMKAINKITLSLQLIGLGITFVSCKKETPTPTPAPTKTELLTGENWMLTSYVIDNVELNGQFTSCQQDNLTIFNANNTITIDEGPTKCDPLDPQTSDGGAWSFNPTETLITLNSSEYELEILNSTTLKIKNTVVGGGMTIISTITFTK